jgi:hypothetical protein
MATFPTVSGGAPADSCTEHVLPGLTVPRPSGDDRKTHHPTARNLTTEPQPHGDAGCPRPTGAAEPLTAPGSLVMVAPAHGASCPAPLSPFPSHPDALSRHGLRGKAVLPPAKGHTAGRGTPFHEVVRTGGLRSTDAAAKVADRFLTEETARSARALGASRPVGARERLNRGTALTRPATARLPRHRADVTRRLP